MIEKLDGLPAGVFGVRCGGTLTAREYRDVLGPLVAAARAGSAGGLRCLVEIDDDFTGLTPPAVGEDLRLALHVFGAFDGVAVVTDIPWVRRADQWSGFFMPFPMRTYAMSERAAAAAWLAGLPAGGAVTVQLDEATGVAVAEVDGALRVEDFVALAAALEPWMREHGELAGLVLHLRRFPGWASLGALVRHVQFVLGHHGKVGHIALATDTPAAEVVASIAGHVVHPQVRAFGYDDLDAARAWAGGASPAA